MLAMAVPPLHTHSAVSWGQQLPGPLFPTIYRRAGGCAGARAAAGNSLRLAEKRRTWE